MQYFFCIGGQKTGTTLLARLLDSQPGVSCIWESYALNPLHDTSVLNPDSVNCDRHGFDRRLIAELRNQWRLDSVDYFHNAAHRRAAFSRTMPSLLDDFARRTDASFVGDKWPWYIRHIDLLLEVFPSCKLIYTVRDPRAVWNSAQRFKARERGDVVLWEILEFDRLLGTHAESDQLMVIRHEDILSHPAESIAKICQFIGLNTTPVESGQFLDSNLSDPRWSWVPEAMTPVSVRLGKRWESEMTPALIRKIEATAGWFMKKYGYPVHDGT